MNNISYNSDLELKGFDNCPSKPFADHFLSFNSRKIEVKKKDASDFGHKIKEIDLPWYVTALKVGLFVLEILTVIPAIVFGIQKAVYRAHALEFISEESTKWAAKRDAFAKINQAFPLIVPEDAIDKWYTKDIAAIKVKLDGTVGDRKAVIDFLIAFRSDDDFVIIANDNKEWKINKYLAFHGSDYLKGGLGGNYKNNNKLKPLRSDKTLYSDDSLNLLANYLNNQDLSSLSASNAKDVYELGSQLLIPELLNEARRFLGSLIDENNLISTWRWAKNFDESPLQLACADFYNKATKKEYKGFLKEITEIKVSADTLKTLKASVENDTLMIKSFDQEALDDLEVCLKNSFIKKLDLSEAKQIVPFLPWLTKLLKDKECSLESLNLQHGDNKVSQLSGLDINNLMKAINTHQKIVCLDLSFHNTQFMDDLRLELRNNHSITSLIVKNNVIQDVFLEFVFDRISPIKHFIFQAHQVDPNKLYHLSGGTINLSQYRNWTSKTIDIKIDKD